MARRKRGRHLHGILLFDKPTDCSSNQALQRVRRLFDANKAGHTGSLDPLATGMLPICFGEATKLSGFLLDANKGYETTMRLGVTTDSADADGDVLQQRGIPDGLDLKAFTNICDSFIGQQMQVPPMVSAIKVNGQRLYKLAREGVTVERKPRQVHFHKIDVLEFNGETARLSVSCSKGTYIRALVSDIGEKIGCGAHVTQLRRTYVAPFEGPSLWSMSQLEQHDDKDSTLLPVDAGLDHLPKVLLNIRATTAFGHGQAIEAADFHCESATVIDAAGSICRVYDSSGQLAGLATLETDGRITPKRVLQMGSGDTIAG